MFDHTPLFSSFNPCVIPTLHFWYQLEILAGRSGTRFFRDGMGPTDSLLGDVSGVCVDPFDTIYFCDYAHGAIRAISPEGMRLIVARQCLTHECTMVLVCFCSPLCCPAKSRSLFLESSSFLPFPCNRPRVYMRPAPFTRLCLHARVRRRGLHARAL